MQKDNSVIFKGGKNGIVILLDEAADFEQIKDGLRNKIRGAKGFFADASTSISFKGKAVNEHELLQLIEIINAETDLGITFVEDLTGQLKTSKAKAPKTSKEESPPPLGTYLHKAGLRGGQAIRHNGCVTVLGDINAGAEVIATGSVVVFGAIRGMVHAGSGGDRGAFVCALSLQPIQLRIADIITYFPKEAMQNKSKIDPVYAFIRDGEIYVAPIIN